MSDDKAPKLQAKHFGLDMPVTITITDVGEGHPWVASGESQYGEWWLYNVTMNGEKRAFFPSGALQSAIMNAAEGQLGAGSQLTICKHERADGGEGVWWAVGLAGTDAEPPGALPQSKPKQTPQRIETREDKIGGINRMANAAIHEAARQLSQFQIGDDLSLEDVRGWASTILIAYQKAGVGPHDFPDIQV